jgi:hypothetical protein
MAQEETPGRQLGAACQYLISEAVRAGPAYVAAALEMVLAQVEAIQIESRSDEAERRTGR